MGLCVFSWPISFVMIERIYILCLIIIIKSEVWTITHCLGLSHETMVCTVCLSIFLFFWLLTITSESYFRFDYCNKSEYFHNHQHILILLLYWVRILSHLSIYTDQPTLNVSNLFVAICIVSQSMFMTFFLFLILDKTAKYNHTNTHITHLSVDVDF